MLLSLCYVLVRRVLHVVVWRWRSNVVKELEIAVLRHELAILRRHTKRPALTTVDRLHGRIGTRCRIDLEPAQYPVRNAGRRAVERFWGGVRGQGGANFLPTIPRNSVAGEWNYRLDLRVFRGVRFTGGQTIEAIAEGFNIFNRSNFNGLNTTIYNGAATTATTSLSTPIVLTENCSYLVENNDARSRTARTRGASRSPFASGSEPSCGAEDLQVTTQHD